MSPEFRTPSALFNQPAAQARSASSWETVIQIREKSPVKFNYINPADDPRGKK